MCTHLRGAAFFGSSIHLALSFVFFFWFIFDTLINEININLWKCDPPEPKFKDIDPLAHYLNLAFKLFYFIILCVTGVYIFRGVERERPRMLKFSALAFIILQVVGVVLFAVFFSIQWNTEPPPPTTSLEGFEAARLVASENEGGVLEESLNTASEQTEGGHIEAPVVVPDSIDNIANTVTPSEEENVLPVPEVIATTTTTPIPEVKITTTTTAVPPLTTTTTTTVPPVVTPLTTATPTTTTTRPTSSPCSTSECPFTSAPRIPRRRLSHNQLVSLVFQMCLAIANGLGSIVYVIVLALYMLKL